MKQLGNYFNKLLVLLLVLALAPIACRANGQAPAAKQQRGVAVTTPNQDGAGANPDQTTATTTQPDPLMPAADTESLPAGTEGRLGDADKQALLCTDAALLDYALTAAKYGRSHDAMVALDDTRFFSVPGPVKVRVKECQMKSEWPKAFVEILDGDSKGRTGWVKLTELKDVKRP